MRGNKLTLLVLLDAFRWDYLNPEDTPFLWSLKERGVYAQKLFNPGGYCERSCFMTGAGPKTTDNYFAMALMPIGYKRPYYEPTFNVPPHIRDRMAMTEDWKLDHEPDSFYNWTKGRIIPSFWDQMREAGVSFHVEACQALGVNSWKGRTTHGSRPIQVIDAMRKDHPDFIYWQVSEIDQQLHYLGTEPDERRGIIRWADGVVEEVFNVADQEYKHVNIIVMGDHGMANVREVVDLSLDYPTFREGWDFLYLKSSAAVQFWGFNERVTHEIYNDQQLRRYGTFIESPTKRQADFIWQANLGVLVNPCHFHGRGDVPRAMHGWDPHDDSQKGMAIVVDGKHKGEIAEVDLRDICPTVCDLVEIDYPAYNEGESLLTYVS